MSKVVLAIATYKRPIMLKRLLRAIEGFTTDSRLEVLVADNDAVARDGVACVESLVASAYRFPLRVVLVEQQGLTYSRNTLLDLAFSDPTVELVAMMDDDQWPEPGWLEAMLRVQKDTAADVVGAAVRPEFEVSPPKWAVESKVYVLDTTTTGPVDMLTGNGGILLSRNVLNLLSPPLYDHAFVRTGGEDRDFFMRLSLAGGRFARAAGAVIHETFPASRMTLRWALMRAFRSGNIDMRLALRYRPNAAERINEAAKILAAFSLSPIALVLSWWSPGRRVDAACKVWRAAGKLAALLGSRYEEYATIHGR